jgi:site-specific DNA-methyltransferase (adenine-specific)
VLLHADCLQLFGEIKDNVLDCIFADPPFNLGKNYGARSIRDNLPTSEYFAWTQQWVSECVRVLKPGGSLFIYHIGFGA